MCSVQGLGPRRALCPGWRVTSSPWGGPSPRLSQKPRLVLGPQKRQGPWNPEKTGLARLGPSRSWHLEADPPEEAAKGRGAQEV